MKTIDIWLLDSELDEVIRSNYSKDKVREILNVEMIMNAIVAEVIHVAEKQRENETVEKDIKSTIIAMLKIHDHTPINEFVVFFKRPENGSVFKGDVLDAIGTLRKDRKVFLTGQPEYSDVNLSTEEEI